MLKLVACRICGLEKKTRKVFFSFFDPRFPILSVEKSVDITGINRSVRSVNLLRIAIYTGREERQSV